MQLGTRWTAEKIAIGDAFQMHENVLNTRNILMKNIDILNEI